jgi:hypothetical protein
MALTKVTQSMIQDGFVDIRDFGAACDWNGSTGTDDTVAIQAAINYGIANHKAVFFPAMSKITASITVAADTRGLQIFGVDRRNTGIYNANTSGADALVVGDTTLNVDTYDISIHDFRIQSSGSNTDGAGLAMHLCHNCQIQNVMVEFTGSHGISLINVNQSTIINTHTRRCGYNTTVTSIAGLRMVGNSGMSIYNHISDECSCGVYLDTGNFYFDGLDTENNQNGGLRVVGASLIQVINGYTEVVSGDNNWYIGDGTTAIKYAFLRNGALGNGAYIYFNKVNFYEIDSYDLGASGTGEIYITAPTTTRGRITSVYPRGADTLSADSATIIQHVPINPIKLTSFNSLLGDNGSFEQDLTTNWTKNWYGSSGTVAVTDVAGLGYDVGTHACQFVVSALPSTYYVRPTYPTIKANRFYTLEFDYFSNGTLVATCTTNGVRHFNVVLPQTTSDGMHYRIIFFSQGTIDILEFEAQATGTYKLDGVMLYEGLYGQT